MEELETTTDFNRVSGKTFTAQIFCGLMEGYSGQQHSPQEAEKLCRIYCDGVGLGLTITPTRFVYTDGAEDGVIVGIINYPRFPSTNSEIKSHAVKICQLLMNYFNQKRMTIVFTDETIMFEHKGET